MQFAVLMRVARWLTIRVVEEGESLVAHLMAGEMHWVLRERPLWEEYWLLLLL